jgi:O-antigen/teichoic acid export membrane protein
VSHVLLQGTDILIIGKILGSQAVVPYFCTAKVLTVLGLQPQILAQTAQPALSELRTSPERDRIPAVCVALTRAILMLSGAIVCIVLVVNEGFVSWWVGGELYEGFTLTAVLLAAMLLRHWNTAVIYSLFSFGRDRRVALTHLSDGVVTVALSIALLTHYGLVGVAAASVLGALLIGLPANVAGLAREMQVSTTHLVASVWPWFWRFSIVCSLSATVAQVWVPRTIPALVITTTVVGGLYTALMLPLALRDPLGMYVKPRLETVRRIVLRESAARFGGE